MSRYIDFYLIGELVDSHGNVHYEDLKNLPATDVVPMEFHERCMELEIKKRANMVEVVRCEDCIHQRYCQQYIVHKGFTVERRDLNYCSYGERREDEREL